MTRFIKRFDVRISVLYGVVATLWILFSDTLAFLLFGNNIRLDGTVSLFKGLGFVAVTAMGLFFLLSTELRKRTYIERELELERDISPVAILVFDANGLISYINVQAEKILGIPRSEIIGQPYNAPSWHVTDHNGNPIDKDYPNISKMVETHQTIYGIQQAIEVVKGKRVLLDINLAPIVNDAGKITGAVVTFLDVTNAKIQEKLVRESEHSLKRAQAIAHVGDWTWDAATQTARWSEEMYRIFGVNQAEFSGDPSAILLASIHPDDKAMVMQMNEDILRNQTPKGLEHRIVWADGSIHYVWTEPGETIIDEHGNIVQMSGIVQDVTALKRAEQDLRLKSAALESSANGVMITDVDGTIEWINPAFTALTGYSLDEAVGQNPRDLIRSGQQNQLYYEKMWNTILAGRLWQGELVNRRKDGSLYTQEQKITPVHNPAGDISHFVAVQQDITERKRQEAAIKALNAELEARVNERTTQLDHIKNRIESILNSNADSIVYSHIDSTIEQVNPAFMRAFGYQADEILMQPLTKLVIAEDVPKLEQALTSVVANRQIQHIDITGHHKDGKIFDISIVLSPVIENTEKIVGIVASIRDITNRNQILQHAMDLSELKSRYVSMAAHDLRNPMAVILTSAETLQHYYDKLTEEKRLAKYDQINASIKVMTDILNDVLVMGQMDSGKLEFRPAPLNINAFCQTLITEAIQATGTSIEVKFMIDGVNDSLPLDAKLLRHILGNLLSNAIKYSPVDSAVTFNVEGADGQLTFHIQDQGIGIPKDEQTRLFETFYRASNAKHLRGTGLGLAIVKQSVELHGGTITFESQEGQGTTFLVSLPMAA
jgi:PAS domain S-box-containing protein